MPDRTWRDMLLKLIEDSDQKARIAEALDVDPKTVGRWADGISTPKTSKMLQLIDVIPEWYRNEFSALVTREYPELTRKVEATGFNLEETISNIQSPLYERVLHERTHAYSAVTEWGICTLILQQCVSQLDSDQSGMIAIIAKCVATAPIRQLRQEYIENGNWPGDYTKHRFYLGAESQAGIVVQSFQPVIINNTKGAGERIEPQVEGINSLAAYPIISFNKIAGCLLLLGSRPNHFSDKRIELLRRYSNLVALAFQESDFYTKEQIQLQLMPDHMTQLVIIARMQRYVYEEMDKAERRGQTLSRREAEERVLGRLLQQEEERLHDPEA